MAFIIGWNMQLEYVIGTASVAKVDAFGLHYLFFFINHKQLYEVQAWSDYVDALSGRAVSRWLQKVVPMNACLYVADSKLCLGTYFDVVAFAAVIALTLLLCKGIIFIAP